MKATLNQAAKVLELIVQSEAPAEHLQKILGSGLFSDLMAVNIDGVDRNEFRRVLGLEPIGVQEFLRFPEELSIQIPALPRPTLNELQAKYNWIKFIKCDDSPEESVTLRLTIVLKSKENRIDGATYERRLVPLKGQLLGFQHQQWLLEHQNEFPEFMAFLGKVYVDFPGIVVVSGDGRRFYPCLDQGGQRWDGYWRWISLGFGGTGRVAVSSK